MPQKVDEHGGLATHQTFQGADVDDGPRARPRADRDASSNEEARHVVGFRGLPADRNRSAVEQCVDRGVELLVSQWLADVAIAAGQLGPVLIGLHGHGGQRDDRDVGGRRVFLQQGRGGKTVHAGKLDIHENELGFV